MSRPLHSKSGTAAGPLALIHPAARMPQFGAGSAGLRAQNGASRAPAIPRWSHSHVPIPSRDAALLQGRDRHGLIPALPSAENTQHKGSIDVTRPPSSTFATREATQGLAALLPIGPEAKSRIRVLVVDDEHTLRETCASVLQLEGYDVTAVGRGQEALEMLKRRPFDVVLLDRYMSQVDGLELLRAALAANPHVLAVVMTGNPSVESSVEALREGAWDYLPKPFSATHLQILIGRAAHTLLVAQETEEQQAEGERLPTGGDDGVVLLGEAPAFQRAIDLARRVAATDASVFLTGESGSGKEMIAQFIHSHSRRSSRPFVAINSPGLSRTAPVNAPRRSPRCSDTAVARSPAPCATSPGC